MTRILIVVALLLLVWWALRRARAQFLASPRGQELRAVWRLLRQITPNGPIDRGDARRPHGGSSRRGAPPGAAISLVRCHGCGTHVPESAARRHGGLFWCSAACEQRSGGS